MNRATDSEISVTDIFELSIGDQDGSIDAPLSSERTTAHRNIPLVTCNPQEKDHEDNYSETNHDVKEMKHNMYDIQLNQEKVHNLQTTENLVAMIKVRSVLVLIGIILSVILLFQIPIILYYTDPPTVDLFAIPDIDIKTCTVSN